MGMFDSVLARCGCGRMVEFQCKSGDCMLGRYSTDAVPVVIAQALDGAVEYCDCGMKIVLRPAVPVPDTVRMTVGVGSRYTKLLASEVLDTSCGNPELDDYVMTVEEFRSACAIGIFNDDDGYGCPVADAKSDPDFRIWPSTLACIPAEATHIVWYDR